ncbi:hypothetical protein NDU88_002198 [Pleurodeles waltl]|uniref:ribonuclease H n=1 Tax=Pleurodeles waltl TaxID=8319 RepID=A0AAV7W270_PLEWA|nr:hypothetical protein NDU88_002198 [Pleurodeles waltl]
MHNKVNIMALGVGTFTDKHKGQDDAHLSQHRARKIPFVVRDEVKKVISNMLAEGIIEPVDVSPWISPVVITRKSDGKVRLCVDLRSVNQNIVVDVYPLPNLNELLTSVKDGRFFSKLDLRSAYHQIRLHPESKHITAFVTPEGTFQFTRMPFGLASAASVFQRMMAKMFGDVKGVLFFQDDVLVMGETVNEHNITLRKVLKVIDETGLSLNKEKCIFLVEEIDYLGYSISKGSIKPKKSLLEAIKLAPAPTDKEQLRSFLGLVEYYSKFVEKFASKTEDLRKLLVEERE